MSRELQTKTGQPLRKPPGQAQSAPQQSSASLCAGKVPAWRPTGHQTSRLSSPHRLWPSSIGILQTYWAFCLQMSGMPGSAFTHKFMNSKFLVSKKSFTALPGQHCSFSLNNLTLLKGYSHQIPFQRVTFLSKGNFKISLPQAYYIL